MRLCYISVRRLIAEAGGDPWAINRTLQAGRPAQISFLAQAFHDGGQRTTDADAAFDQARRRFEASWNRENGDHPINDAAEVQRATQSLGVQATQLPKIAIDLERVAAVLAEVQRATVGQIRALEGQLEVIDHEIGDALEFEHWAHLSGAQSAAIGQHIADLEQQAIGKTSAALKLVGHIRDMYAELLHRLMTRMRAQDGYDSAPVMGLAGQESALPELAEREVHAALAGDQRAASRVNQVLNSITAEQRAGNVPLSAEQASVLSQLQAQQHGMSINDLSTAEERLGDQRQMIGNSWQLMSNPCILFPKTELKPGGQQGSETLKGGAAQLPKSVQQAFDSPWVPYNDVVVGSALVSSDPMKIIANIVKQGNPAFQTNTDLDRRMIRRASAMMDATFGESKPADGAQIRLRDIAFAQIVSDMLGAVSPDHQVVHDALTGPDHDTFLQNVIHHFWLDQGSSVASLFDWTEAAAHGPEAGIAGESARAYGSYVGSHEPELLHLPGSHTLGEVNPKLVQGMAHGLAPYISNIAGTSGALAEFGYTADAYGEDNDSGRMPLAKGIFSVLSTDRVASDYFNGTADGRALVAESAYAQALAGHAPNMDSYNANLHDAMTLRGLVHSGIHNAVQADAENHHTAEETAQRTEHDQRKTAYELGIRTLSAAAVFVPGVGAYAGPGIGIIGQAIENDVVGAGPLGAPLPTDHPLPNMSIGRADREILNAVIASGQRVEGIPPQYLIDGRIGSLDELVSRGTHAESGDYDAALSRVLGNLFTQIYGNDSGRTFIPDRDMMNRYNAVTQDPNPLKK